MKRIIKQYQKSTSLDPLNNLHKSIDLMAVHRIDYAERLNIFVNTLSSMVNKICPEYEVQMQAVRDVYSRISACNLKLARAEHRCSEDLRDISERFLVIERINNEYIQLKESYQTASNNLIAALADELAEKEQPNYDKIRAKIEASIVKAKADKNTANEFLKRKINELIEAKDKYNKFKARRLKSAWQTLAEGLDAFAQSENTLYEELKEKLEKLKTNEIPQELVDSISENSEPLPNPAENEILEQMADLRQEIQADEKNETVENQEE